MKVKANDTKHTPGPWIAEKDETAEVWDIRCEDGTVAMTDDWDKETNEANARLIASAPELLAALKNEHDKARDTKTDEAIEQHSLPFCSVCLLIAKAEGR